MNYSNTDFSVQLNNSNILRGLENLSGYQFTSSFKIYEDPSIFTTFLNPLFKSPFPKISDVKITDLERKLNASSRIEFSKNVVGFLDLGSDNENIQFFNSRDYNFFSRSFVGNSFYNREPEHLTPNGIHSNRIKPGFNNKLLPFLYFLESEDKSGKIILRDYAMETAIGIRNYQRGLKVKIGLSPKKDGEETLDVLKSMIISLYGKGYQRLDLNN